MKTSSLRIPDSLHKAIKQMAEHNHRSLNGEILRAIEFYLNSPEMRYEISPKPKKKISKQGKG